MELQLLGSVGKPNSFRSDYLRTCLMGTWPVVLQHLGSEIATVKLLSSVSSVDRAYTQSCDHGIHGGKYGLHHGHAERYWLAAKLLADGSWCTVYRLSWFYQHSKDEKASL